MSVTRAQKVRLGIFVLVSTVLLGAMVMVLVGGRLTRQAPGAAKQSHANRPGGRLTRQAPPCEAPQTDRADG